ncbi:helix-turn-helix transcriptional regulator [Cellulomonas sp. NPDC089187]|uniref:helix-turn-helix domain-containing protein n=1 Tax=Cellulomonas sp. NPDC089187 TaxID=3154970 RepID=UPI00341C6FE7
MTVTTTRPASLIRRRREPLWRELLGIRLRQLRHESGETLGETAERAGVSPQYLSEMERGVKDPSSEMIAAVAGALGVTLLDLTVGVAEELGGGGSVQESQAMVSALAELSPLPRGAVVYAWPSARAA